MVIFSFILLCEKKPANKKSDLAEENKSIIVSDAIAFRLALLQ